MLKLSNIFLKVSIILSIICIVTFAFCALGCFICVPFAGAIAEQAAESGASGAQGTIVEAGLVMGYLIAGGIAVLMCIPLYAVLIHISLKGRREPSRGTYIANIVLGAICGSEFNVAAGIVGLCRLGKEEREAKNASSL